MTATETLTLEGVLTCYRYANWRSPRSGLLAAMVADAVAPLPPYTIWTIHTAIPRLHGPPAYRAEGQLFRARSGRLPGALAEVPEGATVVVKAQVTPWANGLGGYLARVRLLEPVS